MAGTSLLTLIDDIATLLDDVALMSKVAVKKTAGVLGDDLALNAQQVAGVNADRELPVVWAVAVGSLKNKVILVPAALLISYFVPFLITPLLMIGGAYLCFEGFEKVFHKFLHRKAAHADDKVLATEPARLKALADPKIDLVELEKDKISGAIRTDFILSAEIIVIALGTVKEASFGLQVAVMVAVALLITVGVYGLVAGIVKLDDLGLYLNGRTGDSFAICASHSLGRFILWMAPHLMRGLGIAGTIAMFLVGGGIVLHGIPPINDWLHHLEETIAQRAEILGWLFNVIANLTAGLLTGGILVAVQSGYKKVTKRT